MWWRSNRRKFGIRDQRPGYWNGESERERMLGEVLSSRRRALWMVLTVFFQAIALVLFALAFVWIGMAM